MRSERNNLATAEKLENTPSVSAPDQTGRPSDASSKPSPEHPEAGQGLQHPAIDQPAAGTYRCLSYEYAGRHQGDHGEGDIADQSRAFLRAASQIDTGRSPSADRETSRIRETESLAEWAKAGNCPLISEAEFTVLPLVSNETSEHEVRFREDDNRAVKRTWAALFFREVSQNLLGKQFVDLLVTWNWLRRSRKWIVVNVVLTPMSEKDCAC